MLLNRMGDTNQKREALQHDYVIRYRQQLKQKKVLMVKTLKERFQKLVEEENARIGE